MSISSTLLKVFGSILAFYWGLYLLMAYEYDYGVLRGIILAGMLAIALGLRRLAPRALIAADASWLRIGTAVFALFALGSVAIGVTSTIRMAQTGKSVVDQAENTYRAALYFLRGENPYAAGMLLDPMAYEDRQPIRDAAGSGSGMPHKEQRAMLLEFWRTLDPALREKLLPRPTADAGASAQREYAALGYKYGPLVMLAVAAFAPLFGLAAVGALNLVIVLAWAAVMGLTLHRLGWSPLWAGLFTALCLADPHVMKSFMFFTCLDAWPMLFSALAVFAFFSGRTTLVGVLLAVAVGCKLFPSLIFLPLLLATRSWRAVAVFVALVGAIYLPWFAWDPQGFATNVLLWPTLNLPDTTSWVMFAPSALAWTLRLALLGVVAAVSLMLVRATREDYRLIVWALAVLNLTVVLASGVIHNNYLPWFSPWLTLAMIVHTIAGEPAAATRGLSTKHTAAE